MPRVYEVPSMVWLLNAPGVCVADFADISGEKPHLLAMRLNAYARAHGLRNRVSEARRGVQARGFLWRRPAYRRLYDTLLGLRDSDPQPVYARRRLEVVVGVALRSLGTVRPEWREVVEAYFGFSDIEPENLAAYARAHGISGAVAQLRFDKALFRLRKTMTRLGLRPLT